MVGFSFQGTIVDSTEGLVSPITGQFSETVPGTNIRDIVSNVTAGKSIVNGGTGSVIVGAAIPEPGTFAMLLAGGLLLGYAYIGRRKMRA
jgi:hypothetical protein